MENAYVIITYYITFIITLQDNVYSSINYIDSKFT